MITESSARFLVLAAIDGSECDERVAEAAAAIAQRFPNGELHFLHVLRDLAVGDAFVPMPSTLGPEMFDEGRAILEAAARAARLGCARPTRAHLTVGAPWREVVRVGKDLGADLVLVGTHDRSGLERLTLGSVAQQIVRHATCPVLLVRPKQSSETPSIEPPCPDCLATRTASSGAQFWCARHAERHPHGHRHYEVPESFGVGSMFLRP